MNCSWFTYYSILNTFMLFECQMIDMYFNFLCKQLVHATFYLKCDSLKIYEMLMLHIQFQYFWMIIQLLFIYY